ncbi:hypothetical protein CsSME_00042730 [Camellia sinensis var. sinensis]
MGKRDSEEGREAYGIGYESKRCISRCFSCLQSSRPRSLSCP